jgi:hypothetical protein
MEAAFFKLGENLLVMHEFAVDGHFLGVRQILDNGQGIAHAEAHAQKIGCDNMHVNLPWRAAQRKRDVAADFTTRLRCDARLS